MGALRHFRAFDVRSDRSREGLHGAGNPAQKLRDLTEKDYESFRRIVAGYVELATSYK